MLPPFSHWSKKFWRVNRLSNASKFDAAHSSLYNITVSAWLFSFLISSGSPCIWTRNSVLMRRAASLSFSFLEPHSESTSSMKMIEGLCWRARSNRFFTSLGDTGWDVDNNRDRNTERVHDYTGDCDDEMLHFITVFEKASKYCQYGLGTGLLRGVDILQYHLHLCNTKK